MYSRNRQSFSFSNSYEEPSAETQQHIKNLQHSYLNNDYQNMLESKREKVDEEKKKKELEREEYKRKSQHYLYEISENKIQKEHERMHLANIYEDMIQRRKLKEIQKKQFQINNDIELLKYKNWVKDVPSQKQLVKEKRHHYSQQLDSHVKAQQLRKRREIQESEKIKQKINAEADEILKKQLEQMKRRSQRKSKFEERQNSLLGINERKQSRSIDLSRNMSSYSNPYDLKRKQKEVYEAGLNCQLGWQEERRKKVVTNHFSPGNRYNPITNPIPIVYKNPNVLKMLSLDQK